MIVTILCCQSTKLTHKPISAAIKLVEGTDFSHYAILISGFVYEAVSPRSRQIHYSEWAKSYEVVRTYTLDLNDVQVANLLARIQEQLNKPYSHAQIIAILLGNIFHLPNKVDFNGKKALICSEFVARPLGEVLGWVFPTTYDHLGMDEVEAVLKQHQF